MTSDLALLIVRAHVAASLLIVLVLAARRPVRSLVGPRVAYALWLLPLIAALAVLAPARIEYVAAPALAPALPAPALIAASAPAFAGPAPVAAPPVDPWQVVLALWGVGAVLSLAWLAVQQVRYLAFVRLGAAGPAVVGLLRPRVVVPMDFEERYSAQERDLILAHERTHLARQDPRVIGLALILRSLAWFNPLAYIAVAKLRIDQELACDETVVSHFPRSRRAYADALAKSQLAIRPLPLGCYWPSGTEHPLLERLSMLNASRIGAKGRLAGAAALTVLAAATGLAAWGSTPAQVRYAPAAAPTPMPASLPAKAEAPQATPAPVQVALLQPAATPAPASTRAAPPLPNLSAGMQATVNTDRPVAFSGTIEKMEWVNPLSVITIRDASGDARQVMTDAPNTLIRGGANRDFMVIGSPISGEGYASKDGARLFAAPVSMSVNGKTMYADAAAYAKEQELRKACGAQPVPPPGAGPDDFRAVAMWVNECEQKVNAGLAAASGPPPAAAFSITTNSVIRQGAQ